MLAIMAVTKEVHTAINKQLAWRLAQRCVYDGTPAGARNPVCCSLKCLIYCLHRCGRQCLSLWMP